MPLPPRLLATTPTCTMVFAVFRLFIIAISSVAIASLVVFFIRVTGEKQAYTAPTHPLLAIKPFNVSWGGEADGAPAFSLKAYQLAAAKNLALGLNLHVSRDGVWFVASENELKKISDYTGFITKHEAAQLTQMKYPNSDQNILKFSDLVSALPNARYYANIENPATPYLEAVFKTIEAAHLEDHFILSTPFADTARLVRERNAKWLTGPTTSETARAEFMSKIFLEPTLTLNSEAFIATAPKDESDFRLLRELSKRHILTLLHSDDATLAHDLVEKNLISGAISSKL